MPAPATVACIWATRVELWREDEVVDIADHLVVMEIAGRGDGRMPAEIVRGGVEPEPIIRELARDDLALARGRERDRDVGLAFRQREKSGHRDELDFEVRILGRERRDAGSEERRAEPVRGADPHDAGDREIRSPDLARRREGLGFHGLGLGEEALTVSRKRVALRSALEELRLERALQRRNAPRHRRVVGAEAAGRNRKATRARHREEEAQVVPVETAHRTPAAILASAHANASNSHIAVRNWQW